MTRTTGGRVEATRFEEFDIARWLAISAVVWIHAAAPGILRAPGGLVEELTGLVRFAVPVFIFIAGALSWTPPAAPTGVRDYFGYLLKRWQTVVIPYAIVSVPYSFLEASVQHTPAKLMARRILVDLATGHAWFHLYFVPIILEVYLLAPFAGALIRRIPRAVLAVTIAAAIALGPALSSSTAESVHWTQGIVHLPYAALGALYVMHRDRLNGLLARTWPILLAASLVFAVPAVSLAIRTPLPGGISSSLGKSIGAFYTLAWTLPVLLGFTGLTRFLGTRFPRLAERAAKTNREVFGIFLVHPALIYAVSLAAVTAGVGGMLETPLFAVALVAVVLPLSFLLVRMVRLVARVAARAVPVTDDERNAA